MINLSDLKIGDFVQLKNLGNSIPNPFGSRENNLFQIAKIWADQVRLSWQTNVYDVDELKPIPINGVDDINIHLQVAISKPCVMDGMIITPEEKDCSYYLDKIKELGWTKLIHLIEQNHIKYVHQVQRYLNEHFADCHLEIDY